MKLFWNFDHFTNLYRPNPKRMCEWRIRESGLVYLHKRSRWLSIILHICQIRLAIENEFFAKKLYTLIYFFHFKLSGWCVCDETHHSTAIHIQSTSTNTIDNIFISFDRSIQILAKYFSSYRNCLRFALNCWYIIIALLCFSFLLPWTGSANYLKYIELDRGAQMFCRHQHEDKKEEYCMEKSS